MDCKNCDNFQDDCLILVEKEFNPSPHIIAVSKWKQGFKCTWNGIESLNIKDLQKGTCRCKGD